MTDLIEAARPYLPGLPEEVSLLPWEAVEHEGKGEVLGLAFQGKGAMALHPGLEGEILEVVVLHELLHLAEPQLSEEWVRALDGLLHLALREGWPPRDVPSLAWLSLEEIQERLEKAGLFWEASRPELFPGPLGGVYERMGVLPDPALAESPLYFFQQLMGDPEYLRPLLEALWPEPLLTRRKAALRIAIFARQAKPEDWEHLEAFLGRDLLPEEHLQEPWLTGLGVPPERQALALSLVDAVLGEKGETYTPPGEGMAEEVVAGLIATGQWPD